MHVNGSKYLCERCNSLVQMDSLFVMCCTSQGMTSPEESMTDVE